jgi:hypothetical protein
MTPLHDLLLSPLILWAFSIAAFLFFLWFIKVATISLRVGHATKVYVVWYTFSLSFVAFSFLGIFARIEGKDVEALFGQFAWVYEWLTGFGAEVATVAVFLGVVIFPQLLAYFFSGLSGCASRPMFVSQATDVATWSLIKTVAGISGISLAGFFWDGNFHPVRLLQALAFLFLSFLLLFIRHVTVTAATTAVTGFQLTLLRVVLLSWEFLGLRMVF